MSDPVFGLSFAGGINQSDQGELVDAGSSFTLLENVRQPHRGAAQKRHGYGEIGATRLDGTTRSEGRRVFANDDQLCTADGTQIDVYVPALGRFVPRTLLPEADFTSFSVPSYGLDLGVSTYVSDTAYVNGYIVVALIVTSSGTRNVVVSVLDAETKAVVRGPEIIVLGFNNIGVSLATYGTICVLGECNGAINKVQLFSIDTASATTLETGWSSAFSITATGTSGQFAMASLPTQGDRIALAYDASSGTNRVIVKTYSVASGVIETVTINTSSTTPQVDSIDLSEHGETLWVCWGITDTAHVMGLNPADIDGTPYATAASVVTMGDVIDNLWIASAGVNAALLVATCAGDPMTVQRVTISGGATVTDAPSAAKYWNALPKSRPFLRGSKVYQWIASETADNLTLCDITQSSGGDSTPLYLRPVVAPVVRGLLASYLYQRARTTALSTTTYGFCFPTKATGVSASVTAVEIDFASAQRWSAVQYHRSTYLTGGVTTMFDGSHAFESGFLCVPPTLGIDSSAAGSLTFSNGGRRYVAVYVSPDADGNLSVSGVSTPTEPTGNITSKKVSVSVKPLSITSRGSRVARDLGPSIYIFVYATEDGGEEPYHLIASIANDPQSEFLTFDDETADLTVASGALLYGSGNLPGTLQGGQPGGPQDHRAPPGLRFLTAYNGMLVGAVDDQVWHTSQPVYGEAPWWSPVFTQQLDATITALFVQDGALYATTKDAVYSLSGDPPNDAGTSGGLSLPRKLAVERGCINARSVCVTSGGTFFQSSRGYELFRSGGITPVGDLVQDTLADFPNVTSAVFDAKRGLVRVSLANRLDSNGLVQPFTTSDSGEPDYGGGRDIIFDTILATWVSVDRKLGSTADQASQDATMAVVDGELTYVWIAADGVVYREAADSLDMLEWVTQRAETGWIRIAGMQGEQFIDRILLLAKMVTAHDLTIELAFDYSDTYTKTRSFTSTQIAALTREWLDAEVSPTTSQAVRVRITDAQPSAGSLDTGEGGKWIDLTFNGQPHRGAKRTSGAQRSG